MKTRVDFVSNSSSSSFIVISDKGNLDTTDVVASIDYNDVLMLPNSELGCTEFGWQTQRYYNIFDKLNWAAIILLEIMVNEENMSTEDKMKREISNPLFTFVELEKMLKQFCKDRFGVDVELRKDEYRKSYYNVGYIDHQSSYRETPGNARMFKSYKMLEDFLMNTHSYIDNSNDNGGRESVFNEETNEYEYVPRIPNDYEE